LSLDQRAKILEVVTSNSYGVKEIIERVSGTRASNIISLVKDMRRERLVQAELVPISGPGRPKMKIVPTSLGYEFLETYRKLKAKPLRSRQSDLERAKVDAAYAERLVEMGHSAFQLFMELNAIVNNIKVSEEAS
jgi:hypothetical protein